MNEPAGIIADETDLHALRARRLSHGDKPPLPPPNDGGGGGGRRPFDWRGAFRLALSMLLLGGMFMVCVDRATGILQRLDWWGEK